MFEERFHEGQEAWAVDIWRTAPAWVRAGVVIVATVVGVGAWVSWRAGRAAVSETFYDKSPPSEATTAGAYPPGVVVHVVGAVRRPGVYTLASGSRVADAIQSAGGVLGNAAADAVNLARVLQDGEQVRVPTRDEASQTASVQDGRGVTPQRVNINTATPEELDALPGVGPATAQKIIEDRARNGPFRTPEDIMRVPGIGAKKFDGLKDLITAG